MSLNLLDSVKQLFSSEIVSKAAAALGESESGIAKAISGVVPTVLGSVVNKATSSEHGAINILQLAKDAAGSGILGNLGNLFSSGGSNFISSGFDILKSLLGDRLTAVEHELANFAGIKTSSASALLSGAAPVALAVLGNHVIANNTSAAGLAQSLDSSKRQILGALPSALGSITNLFGSAAPSLSGSTNQARAAATHSAHTTEEKTSNSMKFLLPLLLGVLVVGLLIYLVKGCNSGTEAAANAEDTVKAKTDTAMASGMVSVKVKLPDGTELDAYKGGIEDRLVAFLMTDYAKLGEDSLKKIWFDFDDLNFKTANAEITPESQHQIGNIAAILKAFPKSNIKIGGYTDKTGDETINKKLSKERAESVRAALDKASVGNQVTGADGYGSDFAKYPATAPEADRVHDRRVSVNVRL